MGDTNYIGSIVRIVESPNQTLFNNTIPITKFRAQLPEAKNNTIVTLSFWGNLGNDVANYYKINDYILIEGYLSIRNKPLKNSIFQNSKKVEITVFKVYPFLLTLNNRNS
jgi:single-stranded DNA-binding protein